MRVIGVNCGRDSRCAAPFVAPRLRTTVRQLAVRATNDDDLSLAARIASGQYSVKGSKKEKLTRPARKLLSKDRVGPGTTLVVQNTGHGTVARIRAL
jgi:hypothetical protein